MSLSDLNADDTIAALATAAGAAGIAIVRLSGPDAYGIADRLLATSPLPSQRSAGSFVHAPLRDAANDEIVDDVIALFFRAPNSYTREDVVEIQGHGGRAAAQRLLTAVTTAGARLAEPGEFTKRAFLNGRIDLLQAEAVADLIRAESDRAAASAHEQLTGSLTRSVDGLYEQLLTVHADVTALLDFSEDEVPQSIITAIPERIRACQASIERLMTTRHEGRLLREGADVVITGRPNVGKSTLLNALLGSERAIVSSTPGTTRDTIEDALLLDGIPVRLTDTAGLRDTSCSIEAAGIQRAMARMEAAHFNVHVADATQSMNTEEANIVDSLPLGSTLLVLNKADVGESIHTDLQHTTIVTSLSEDPAATHVREALRKMIAGSRTDTSHHAVISERHYTLLAAAGQHVSEAITLAEANIEELLLVANELNSALRSIAAIIGRNYSEELLDSVFSGFCLGK